MFFFLEGSDTGNDEEQAQSQSADILQRVSVHENSKIFLLFIL